MQQVAASNNDIAAQKLFPGDIDAQVSGAGNEFAKIMTGKSGATDSGASEQNYRGHSDIKSQVKDDNKASDIAVKDKKETNFKLESPNPENKEANSDDSESLEGDDLHEEWVSIIQKLNGGSAGVKPEAETDAPVNEEDPIILLAEASLENDISKQAAIEVPENTENTEITEAESWKQQLKDKLLNSGQTLDIHQMKSMDKTVNGMTDEEIQQLLNDDQALKQMLSDILKAEEPDPQDIALLMALAEQNNEPGQQNTINLEELSEAAGSAGEAQSEGSGNNEEAESQEQTLLNELQEQVAIETKTGIETDPAPSPEPVPETSVQGSDNTSSNTVATDETLKTEQQQLAQLLSELDNATGTDESKLAAIDNLTRRIESSDVAQTSAGKKFLESLKNVAAEFKEQLKSGREPGININQMVTEAMVSDASSVESLALEQQVRGALQQMVNVAQANSGMDTMAREALLSSFNSSVAARENTAAQIDAQKNQQQNIQNQAFDKAINIQKPEAAQELANKVQVMMNQKNMVADIRLDPPDLGQMQIKITMQGDSASVSMVVQSQAAREVLEQNQPRLKELLEQQGIELGQSSVHEEQQGQKGEGDGQNFASGKGQEAMDDLEAESSNGERAVELNEPEGIDYFA